MVKKIDEDGIKSAHLSPDCKLLVCVIDNIIRIREASHDYKILCDLSEHTANITNVSFSSDGKYLLSASDDQSIRVWDLNNMKCINVLKGHNDGVDIVKYGYKDNFIVSVTDRGECKIWNSITGECIQSFDTKCDYIKGMYTNSTNEFIIYTGDHSYRLYFPPLQELIGETRERFKNRKLTPEERRKYYLE